MELESARIQRLSVGEENLVISMEYVQDIMNKNPKAFKNHVNALSEEVVDVNDIMVYNKSVFDMCNEILGELHQLRHRGEALSHFSKKSVFSEKLIAETIPLTTKAISEYVLYRIERLQSLKADVCDRKSSTDSLADSSRAATEFERQYNFLLAQTIDETTDVLMARLLLDTVSHFRKKYPA